MKIIMIFFCLVFASYLSATIINIPADQPTIQAGINVAVEGDTVLVQPNTYYENIDYVGKNITVASLFLITQDTTYVSQTIIDGNQNGSVITFENSEDSTAVLIGFKITNGLGSGLYPNYIGGAITCHNSSPSFRNLTLTGNTAESYGGGIFCYNSSPNVDNVIITFNTAYGLMGGGGISCLNSSLYLKNVILIGNIAYQHGGAIYCKYSYINLSDVAIIDNASGEEGGGIYCYQSSGNFENVEIIGNTAEGGGGIYCYSYSTLDLINVAIKNNTAVFGGGIASDSHSLLNLENVTIKDNNADLDGGGFYCAYSPPIMNNVKITGNSAVYNGGGIYFYNINTSAILTNVIISDNTAAYGGGISFNHSTTSLENVSVTNNVAYSYGGGIYCYNNSTFSFSSENRCNIYLNSIESSRGTGTDFFAEECNIIEVIVDTFTVVSPTDYYASPIDNYTFDIQHGVIDSLINADVYVSVNGDDSNIGTSPEEPFKTIDHALSVIYSDSLNHNTIHLAPGVYSNSTNGETYPINWSQFVSLSGSGEEETILDANNSSSVMVFYGVTETLIQNITIRNGSSTSKGGGIYFNDSSPSLKNVTITNNTVTNFGGGIYCMDSSPNFENVTITNNTASWYGGGITCHNSSPSLKNVTITGNSAADGGGIYCWHFSNPSLVNVTITGNSAADGGGIYCHWNSNPILINCILWYDSPEEVYFDQYGIPNTITISYSDIQGGEIGIVTNNNGTVNWLEGNIDADPLFADPQNGDFHLTWANFPIPDSTMSPCIDAGDPNSLFDPDGTIADMGTYYYNQGTGTENYELKISNVKLVNHPNPFNPTTTISFSIPEESKIELSIYNIKGQKIKSLLSDQIEAGEHTIVWNGTDDNNKPVSSGVYLYNLNVNNKTEAVKKCLLLK